MVFIHSFANMSSRTSLHFLSAFAPAELLGQRLWLQLFLTDGMGPLKEYFWFHHLLPVISMTLNSNHVRRFLRSCENQLCCLQVCPTVSGVGGCSCMQVSSPLRKPAVNFLLSLYLAIQQAELETSTWLLGRRGSLISVMYWSFFKSKKWFLKLPVKK